MVIIYTHKANSLPFLLYVDIHIPYTTHFKDKNWSSWQRFLFVVLCAVSGIKRSTHPKNAKSSILHK